jgi:lipopolysaccharide biosynthesis glycosyltransferase
LPDEETGGQAVSDAAAEIYQAQPAAATLNTPICTQCDEAFLPGLKALYNSYLRHSQEGFDFYAFLVGRREFAEHVQNDLGINVIFDPAFPSTKYPTSKYYPVAHPIMYKNMLMPDLFADCAKSVYIDTDSLILQNLQPLVDLDIGDKVLAATRCNSDRASNYSGGDAGYGPMTSLMIFNHRPFRDKQILPRFAEAMQRDDMDWPMIGQGVLHYVVGDDWYEMPWNTQAHAGHATYFAAPKKEIYTLHFMGTKPWLEFSNPAFITDKKMETRKLWQTYLN